MGYRCSHLYPVLLYSYGDIQFFAARGRHDDVIKFKMAMVNFQSYYASIDIPYTQFGLFLLPKRRLMHSLYYFIPKSSARGAILLQLVQMHIYATKIVSKCYYLHFDILQALSAEKKYFFGLDDVIKTPL